MLSVPGQDERGFFVLPEYSNNKTIKIFNVAASSDEMVFGWDKVEMANRWDQQVIRTKLEHVASAIEVERNQLPKPFISGVDLSHVECGRERELRLRAVKCGVLGQI